MNRKPNFLGYCPKHHFDLHDGSKNECCDQGNVLPILGVDEIKQLTPQGIQLFHEDFAKLMNVVESSDVALPAKAAAWVEGIGPEISAVLAESQQEAAADEGGVDPGEGADAEYWEGYASAFERGFALGYDKGFDLGTRLNPKK